jgi:hypothetical protein
VKSVCDNLAWEMLGQRLAPRSRLRFRSRGHAFYSGFHLGLGGLQLFQMEFKLFELKNHLLALDTEHPALQLLDDQLQVLDLLAAGTQFPALFGEYLPVALKLGFESCQLGLMRKDQCRQCFSIELVEIRQRSAIHGRSMPSMRSECTRKCARIQRNLAGQSNRDLGRPGPLRPAPINAFE